MSDSAQQQPQQLATSPHPSAAAMSASGVSAPAALDVRSPTSQQQQAALAQHATALSPGPQSPTRKPLSYLESMLVLTQGAEFVKYASHTSGLAGMLGGGQPVIRYVFYEKGDEPGGMGALYWCKAGRRVRDANKCIRLRDVTALFEQAETQAFAGKVGASLSPSSRARCFSIVAKERTLDLQASSLEQRDIWMHCQDTHTTQGTIHQILVHSGFGVHEKSGSSPNPGNFVSPTSASLQAMDEANRLNAQAQHARGNSTSVSLAMSPNSSTNTNLSIPMSSPGSGAQMLSPQQAHNGDLPPATPLAEGAKAPANSPVNGMPAVPASSATANIAQDPLLAAKLMHSLSPSSAAEMSAALAAQQGGSGMEVPAHGDAAAVSAGPLSPSEHPTQTPACSPTHVA